MGRVYKKEYRLSPFKSLVTGILISIFLTLLLYFGINFSYKYLARVALSLIATVVLSSLIFWFNLKHDYMSDLTNMISSTVAFDFRFSHSGHAESIARCMRRINPYIGALATLSGLLFFLWVIPALIINLLSPPETSDKYIHVSVLLINTLICTAYLFSNKDQFNEVLSKVLFLSGALLGVFGSLIILTIIFS